ncbi:MAG: 50S ribosomal protein L13 [Candidatus Aenigmarchaeota archaeon]|nr:50S ribosomal protein L13 [Candidatus Aenigmarchaeota archaeon]
MMIIDGTDLILGRMASEVAKKLLAGDTVVVVNAEKIVISGSREAVFAKYKKMRDCGDVYKGPFVSRMPDRLVRRTVRGMLPRKKAKGKDAFGKLSVHIGVPDTVKDKPEKLDVTKDRLKNQKYVTVLDLSKWLGAKV